MGGAGALALAVVVMLIATIARARDAAAHEEELIPQPVPVPPMKTPAAEGDLPTTPETPSRCVTAVPSPAATPSLDAADPRHHARGESRKLRCTDTPLGRPGQPAELAPVYVLLTSDEGSYISGARVAVTGALVTTCRATKVTRVRAAVLNDADGRARPRTTYAAGPVKLARSATEREADAHLCRW